MAAVGRGPSHAGYPDARGWATILTLIAIGVFGALLAGSSRVSAARTQSIGVWTGSIDDVRVELQVEPMHPGTNLFTVKLQSAGRPVTNAEDLRLQVGMLDMDMGESVVYLAPLGQGVYAGKADVLSMGGNWRVRLLMALRGQPEKGTAFYVYLEP